MAERVEVRERRQGDRCPYCLDSLGESPQECLACGARCHVDCRQALGRCPTLGCDGKPTEQRPVEPARARPAPTGAERAAPERRRRARAAFWAREGLAVGALAAVALALGACALLVSLQPAIRASVLAALAEGEGGERLGPMEVRSSLVAILLLLLGASYGLGSVAFWWLKTLRATWAALRLDCPRRARLLVESWVDDPEPGQPLAQILDQSVRQARAARVECPGEPAREVVSSPGWAEPMGRSEGWLHGAGEGPWVFECATTGRLAILHRKG